MKNNGYRYITFIFYLYQNHMVWLCGSGERDEMLPSIKVAKSIAKLIDTTVGYLLGESEQTNVLKDSSMLQRLNQISNLSDNDKHCILYTLDGLLQNVRTQQAFVK